MHPTPDMLAAFDAGQLSQHDHATIEEHLAMCPECCRALEKIPESELSALIRRAAGESKLTLGQPGQINGETAPSIPPEFISHPRYRILEPVGSGGMGVVYRALQIHLDRIVAVKVLHRPLTMRTGFADRFFGEVKALARLNHPHVVAALDADRAGELHFLVMEFVEGESLESIIHRRGPLPIAEACEFIRQAAKGLQHAHENGIVHRDVKPGNLLLSRGGVIKIVDFGLYRMIGEDWSSSSTTVEILGTPEYMAPEQCRKAEAADIRSDVYALGCTLYFLLTGRPPFITATPFQTLLAHQDMAPPAIREIRPDVALGLAAILERMLAKDPIQRFACPSEVAQSLAPFAKSHPVKRNRTVRMLLLGIASLAMLAATTIAILIPRDPPPDRFETTDGNLAKNEPAIAMTPLEIAPVPRPGGPTAVATAEQVIAMNQQAGAGVLAWARENIAWGKEHKIVKDIAMSIDKHLPKGPAGFMVLLGSQTVKSGKPTLRIVRYGVSYSFELTADQANAVKLQDRSSVIDTLPAVWDLIRARPNVELSNLQIESAEGLNQDQPVKGSVHYRFLTPPRPGSYLRMMYYLPDNHHAVMLNHNPKGSLANESAFRFRFDPLGFGPFRDKQLIVLFAEWVTRDGSEAIIEGPAAATLLRLRFNK